jgi:hypothetical protein
VVWRDRTLAGDGAFTGGETWFQGIVIQVPRVGAPDAESMAYRIAGPWWYLENLTFQQAYQNIFLGYAVAGDPTTPAVFGAANSSHLFLNQAPVANALEKITSRRSKSAPSHPQSMCRLTRCATSLARKSSIKCCGGRRTR